MKTKTPKYFFSFSEFRALTITFLFLCFTAKGFAQQKGSQQLTDNNLPDAFAKPDGEEQNNAEDKQTVPSVPQPANEPIAKQPESEVIAKPTPTRWSEWNRGATEGSPTAVQQAEKPLLGSYYLAFRPNLHLAQNIDLNGIAAGSGEIETETGIGIGFELGRYLDDWEMLLSVGYDRTPLANLTLDGAPSQNFKADGSVSAYHFMVGGARRFHLGDKYVLRGSVLLGMANRHDHYKISGLPFSLEEEGMQPTASIEMLFDYKVSETLTLSGGYGLRFLGNADRFSNLVAHSIELGGVWNL
jgi:hypothetical protein